MAAAVKAGLLLGAVLFVGGGVAAWFVAPRLVATSTAFRRRVGAGTLLGFGLLAVLSALDLVVTIQNAIGRVDPGLLGQYLVSTRHGRATLARYGLLAALGLVALGQARAPATARPFRLMLRALFAALAVALLGTFSVTSHAAAMGGRTPFLVDLAHFAAACAWAGPLVYLALHPGWRGVGGVPLREALINLSRVGLLSVGLLFVSGLYSSLLHIQDPPAFVASPYGRVLGVKVGLALLTVGLAGLNRFWLLPTFARGRGGLPTALRAETVVLVAVFAATGVLSTSPLPHAGEMTGVLANVQTFWAYLSAR